jgi:Mg2+ and Co2+ transporter CorA
MDINDYRLSATYNKEVNEEMNSIIKTLTDEE